MTAIYGDEAGAKRVVGVAVDSPRGARNIRARKAVVIATGGSTGNVNFRRIFDARLTEEYCGLAGMPYSNQDASGELAALAVGASLWGTYNQSGEFGEYLHLPGVHRRRARRRGERHDLARQLSRSTAPSSTVSPSVRYRCPPVTDNANVMRRARRATSASSSARSMR